MAESRRHADPNLERRVPPHSLEAETAVLGGVLLRNEALDRVRDLLQPKHFYHANHQIIFAAMCAMQKAQSPIDPITLREFLKLANKLEQIGGIAKINKLMDEVHTTANVEEYARIVAEKFMLRGMLDATHEMQGMIFESRGEDGELLCADEILTRGQSLLQKLSNRQMSQVPFLDSQTAMQHTMDEIERSVGADRDEPGLTTGFVDLNRKMRGMKPGSLIILAARPSIGKTALALAIAEKQAAIEKVPILFFSLEATANEISKRRISSVSGVALEKIDRGRMTPQEMTRVSEAAEMLANQNLITIDESSRHTIDTIAAKCRRFKAEHGLIGGVIVDYVQLISSIRARKNEKTRDQELGEISRAFKILAKDDLNCWILALSQLNRSVENRDDKRPRLSDLRESGNLEQDANQVLLMYRDAYYNPDTDKPNEAEVNVAKNRDGPTGIVKLLAELERMRFDNFYQEEK
jgi:replicative DNA helicase